MILLKLIIKIFSKLKFKMNNLMEKIKKEIRSFWGSNNSNKKKFKRMKFLWIYKIMFIHLNAQKRAKSNKRTLIINKLIILNLRIKNKMIILIINSSKYHFKILLIIMKTLIIVNKMVIKFNRMMYLISQTILKNQER
jgi:hypothetical protein